MWIIPSNIYHYVQDTEALISDSQEFYQMCEQSLMWRSKPSQSTTWSRRLKRAGWMQHLFGRTLKPSHGEAFTRKWTSCLEDSLVSLSQQQEEEECTQAVLQLLENRKAMGGDDSDSEESESSFGSDDF